MVWQKLGHKDYGSSSGDSFSTDTYTAKETSQWFSHGEANGNNNSPRSFFNGNETDNDHYSTRQNWHASATGADTTSVEQDNISDSSGNDDDFFKMGYLCDVSGEQKLFIAFAHGDHSNNYGNVYASVGKIEAGIGTTITKYGQWDSYWENDFQTWTNVTVVGGDTDLAVSPLANLTGFRTNTIFEQTDDVPAYYWYQTLDGVTAWFPTFAGNFVAGDWTAYNTATIGTNELTIAIPSGTNRVSAVYDLGTISSDKWVLEYTVNFSVFSVGASNFWFMGLLNTSGWIASGATTHLGTTIFQESGQQKMSCSDGVNTQYNAAFEDAQNFYPSTTYGNYYFRLSKLSATTYKSEIFSDSARTVRTHLSEATNSAMSDLRYLQFTGDNNANSGSATFLVSDIKFYNGVSSV